MRRRPVQSALVVLLAAASGIALANGCSATGGHATTSTGSFGGNTAGTGGHASTSSSGASMGGSGGSGGGGLFHMDAGPDGTGGAGGSGGVAMNQCGSKCGPVELCDPAHLGLDDNCNGLVDEGCPCVAGTAHSCFKGDPSYLNSPGCFPGTEICTEQGMWGPCVGGVHAFPPDNCFQNDTTACHAITAAPFAVVDLKTGTGTFSANAVPGSEQYAVQCPPNLSQCPGVMAPDSFEAVVSGEYTVTYTKVVSGDPNPISCTFPLFVGAPGLRVELSWEHTMADMGVDLDLHVHQPDNTMPWGISPGVEEDCTWSTCVASDYLPFPSGNPPQWFAPPPAMPPTPVNWYDAPNPADNTCYDDPKMVGPQWSQGGMGCHNPRLDADVITCDATVTDPNDPSFCTPENINVDYPPTGQWFRVGVHYYNNHGLNYDVHPDIKIWCNGALAADLGPQGYYGAQPADAGPPDAGGGGGGGSGPTATPVTFEPADGAGIGGNRFWIVADVGFSADMCGKTICTVKPIYSDKALQTPLFTIDTAATSTFLPAYPAPP